MKTSRLLSALLVVCAFVGGAEPRAQTQALSMPGYPAAGAPATVKILATGSEPKKQLRYTIPASHKSRMDMTTTISMAMNFAGMAVPMDMPTIKTSTELAVTSVAANGDISYSLAFTSATAEGGAVENPTIGPLVQSAIAAIRSIKGSVTVSNRGVTKASKLDGGDPALQQIVGELTSTVENLSMPFPEEAVGAGAKWQVREGIVLGGQTIFQQTTYELISIDGPAVSLKVTMEQTAPPQSVSNATLLPGAEMSMDKLTGSGTGTTVIRLDSLVPTSQMNAATLRSMTMSMGGQSSPITAETKTKVSVAPGKDR